VLHHFGSRELLVKAVCTRSLQAIHVGLVEAIAGSTGGDDQLAGLLDGVYDALTKSGHARVMMWLALEGQRLDGADVRLDQVVSATHELRKKRVRATGSRRAIPVEDTAHTVVLAALALVGSAVIGPPIFENAGLGGDAAAGVRFRSWLAKLLTRHLEGAD
jgi:AcrR family transcriptional regulator